MSSNQKAFVWTFLAVVAGIYLYSRYKSKKPDPTGTVTIGEMTIKSKIEGPFYGPAIDPLTGAYLPPGNQAGTVSEARPDESNTAPEEAWA
jgi:hypothetical protein